MKKIFKYQIIDVKNSILAFYGIYIALTIVGSIIALNSSGDSNVISGFGFAEIIFCFVLGIAMFKEYYWIATQNSISRKTYYKGTLCTLIIASVIISILNEILYILLNILNDNFTTIHYVGVPELLYNISNTPAIYFINFIFSFFMFSTAFLSGYFIAILFYKANKFLKIVIAAGIPITLFMLLPMIFSFSHNIMDRCMKLVLILFGINSGNPIYGIITLFVISLMIAIISYPLIKKTQVV